MNKYEEGYTWSRKNHSLFESYAVGLQEFWRGAKKVDGANRMTQVSLDKQREALKENGLHMTYEMTPRGHFAEKPVTFGWKDGIYSNQVECRSCSMTRKIYRGTDPIFEDKDDVLLYQTITEPLSRERVSKDRLHNCPNCGAVSTIEQLQEACPYCRTRFQISDLFPVVTNFYTVKDFGKTDKETKKELWKYRIPTMLVVFVIAFLGNLKNQPDTAFLLNLLAAVLIGGIGGYILGYFVYSILLLGSGLKEAGKVIPMAGAIGSRKRFIRTVQKYTPEFSYEYFTDKVVAILRQLLSENNMEHNPYYVGKSTDIDGASIVEYAFRGAMSLKSCRMEGTRCHVLVDVFMTHYYLKNEKIKKKNDVFRVELTKDLAKTTDYHFTLSAVHCKSCGGSFDASRQKKCPYCHTDYRIADEDWVVTSITKK